MPNINQIIANPRTPNFLSDIVGGLKARQSLQAGDINLEQAKVAQQRQGRLGEITEQQKLQQLFSGKSKQVRDDFTFGIKKASALTQGRDPEEFATIIQASDQFDDDDKASILELGFQGVQSFNNALSGSLSSGQKEFRSLTANLSSEEAEKARRIKLGLDPRAVGSSVQTITGLGTAEDIAKTEATIGESKKFAEERGTSRAKLQFKPEIEKAVIAARLEAKNRGEVLNEFNQARAALPSLTSAVDQLRELSTVATSTFGGKVFDTAVKETGFGSTKGATARAKFIAIINNQVLPLLKPTFGAAFTVQEGESLKATMGDPDATPEAKMAQLDAFIAQKLRDIETKQAQLTPGQQPAQPGLSTEEQAELQQLRALKAQKNGR